MGMSRLGRGLVVTATCLLCLMLGTYYALNEEMTARRDGYRSSSGREAVDAFREMQTHDRGWWSRFRAGGMGADTRTMRLEVEIGGRTEADVLKGNGYWRWREMVERESVEAELTTTTTVALRRQGVKGLIRTEPVVSNTQSVDDGYRGSITTARIPMETEL